MLSRLALGAVVLSVVTSVPAAHAVATPRAVSLPDVVAAPGETVYVPLRVAEAGGLQRFQFSLYFDPTELAYEGFHTAFDMPLNSSVGGYFPQPDGMMRQVIGGGAETPLPPGPATVLMLELRTLPSFSGVAHLRMAEPTEGFAGATLRNGTITVGIPPFVQIRPDIDRPWLPSTAKSAPYLAVASNPTTIQQRLTLTDAIEPWAGDVLPYATSDLALQTPSQGPVRADVLAPASPGGQAFWQRASSYALRIRQGAELLDAFGIDPNAPASSGKEWWAEKVVGAGHYRPVRAAYTTGPADGEGFELSYTYDIVHDRELHMPGGLTLYDASDTEILDGKFVALSFGDRAVLDRAGNDLAVHVSAVSNATYAVYGSVRDDCTVFRMAAEGLRGTSEVDLAGADVGWSRCVLVVNQMLHGMAVPATTVDGVRAISLGVILRNPADATADGRAMLLDTATAMDVTPLMREGAVVTIPPSDGAGTTLSLVGTPRIDANTTGELLLQSTNAFGMDRFAVTIAYDSTLMRFDGATNASPADFDVVARALEPMDGLTRVALTASSDLRVSTEGVAPLLRVRFAAFPTPTGTTTTVKLLDPAFDAANATLRDGTVEILSFITGQGKTLWLPHVSAERGMNIELPLRVSNGLGIDRFGATVAFDPRVLALEMVDSRHLFHMMTIEGTPSDRMLVAFEGEREMGPLPMDGEVELAFLTFRVLNDAPAGISPVQLSRPEDDLFNAALVHGSMTIPELPAPEICTTFSYGAWSECEDSLQSRDVTASAPAGCEGGSPVVTQTCVEPPPPVDPLPTVVSLPWRTAERGSLVEMPLMASPGKGIEEYALVISYDPSVLLYESSTSEHGFLLDNADGSTPDGGRDITVMGHRPDGPLEIDGPAELAMLRFRVLEDAPAGLSRLDLWASGFDITGAVELDGTVEVAPLPVIDPPPVDPLPVCVTLRKPDVEEGGTHRTQQKVLNLAGEVCAGVTSLTVNNEDVPLVAGNGTWHAQLRLDLGSTRVRIVGTAEDGRSDTVTFTAKREEKNPVATDAQSFQDVPKEHFASNAIEDLRAKGVVEGDGTKFEPERFVTRAEFVKMLAKTLGVKPGSGGSFTDVPERHTLRGFIAAAVERGWAKGDAGQFRPDRHITRMEAARMIQRARKLKAGTCSLSDVSGEEKDVACGLVRGKIVSGNNGRFEPNRPLTRGEAAKMLAAL